LIYGGNKDRREKVDTAIHSIIYAGKHVSNTIRAKKKSIEWISIKKKI